MIEKSVSIFLFCFCLTFTLTAQQTTGNLEGSILDPEDKPLPDVNIEVTSRSFQGTQGTTTDERGYFRLLALPPGIYKLKITHIAHHDVILDDVKISLGKTSTVGYIKLTSQTLEMPEVVIYGSQPLIDPATTLIGANLTSAEFENYPIERNYREMATLLPQANISYLGDEVNIAGATGRETKYFIDGLDVSDNFRGAVEANLPYNFIKEVQLSTGGYEAEYKSSLGGLVNVITNSGGNELHGSTFGFYTADWLATSPKVGLLDPAQGPFSNYDAGFSIGGPILHDKLWYYTAYNPTFKQRDVALPGLGLSKVDKTVTHAFAAKLTWKPSPQLNVVFTSTGDPAERTAIGNFAGTLGGSPDAIENPDVYLSKQQLGGVNLSLIGSYTVGDYLIFDAAISRMTRDEIDEPSTKRGKNDALLIDLEKGSWSGGLLLTASQKRFATDVRLSATLLTGNHLIKTGIGYRDQGLKSNLDINLIQLRKDTTYRDINEGENNSTLHNRVPSFFIQDSWRINRNLRLNAGVRWDGQFFVASNGKVAQEITNLIQPRVGFIFMPDDKGRHKIFGSYGRFTQEVHTGAFPLFYSEERYLSIIDYKSDPRLGNAVGDTLVNEFGSIYPKIPGLRAQYYDEFSLGYEHMLSSQIKLGVKGIYRTLKEAIESGKISLEEPSVFGNPGRGNLSDFPKAQRDYTALVLSIEKHSSAGLNFQASYVLSRNYGNYPGLFDLVYKLSAANSSSQFNYIESLRNGTGLLPNDRTHAFKLLGSYNFTFGLVTGTSFTWQSGTPLSEMASYSDRRTYFLSQRGTAGRTPDIWDLSIRLAYDLPIASLNGTRLILDLFHIASQRRSVQFEEQKYFNVDENGIGVGANSLYGKANRYQPPMTIRLGMKIDF